MERIYLTPKTCAEMPVGKWETIAYNRCKLTPAWNSMEVVTDTQYVHYFPSTLGEAWQAAKAEGPGKLHYRRCEYPNGNSFMEFSINLKPVAPTAPPRFAAYLRVTDDINAYGLEVKPGEPLHVGSILKRETKAGTTEYLVGISAPQAFHEKGLLRGPDSLTTLYLRWYGDEDDMRDIYEEWRERRDKGFKAGADYLTTEISMVAYFTQGAFWKIEVNRTPF